MLTPLSHKLLHRAIRAHVTPAIQYAVLHHDHLIASAALGHFTYAPDSPPVITQTLFDLASLTKVVAATSMAMLLWQDGKLDLEQPICALLPEFCAQNGPFQRDQVTLRMLLAHSSGLPEHRKFYLHCTTRQELLEAALTTPLQAPPGQQVEYSDIGFILLGLALQCLAGEPLDSFVQRRLFAPLNLLKTGYLPDPALRSQIAPTDAGSGFRRRMQGEVHDDNCFVLGGVSAHAGLFSTAEDLARFAQCLLRGGSPVFQPATIQAFTRREQLPPGTSRALGWDTPSPPASSGKYFSPRSYGHLGYTGTSLWIDPEADLAIALLTNRVWPDSKSQGIKKLRPAFHNAVREELGLT